MARRTRNHDDLLRNARVIVLRTERLVLRWFSPADAAFVLELVNEPSWIRFIGDRGLKNENDARAWIDERLVAGYRRHGFGLWAMERREDGALVGMCGLVSRASLPDVDLGYALVPRFWQQGYAREAAIACLDYAESALGLPRVLAITSPDNERSIRLLELLGMRNEGPRMLEGEEHELTLFSRDASHAVADDDSAQIDALIARFFAAFSNRDGAVPRVAALPHYFAPDARISKAQSAGVDTWNVDEFMTPRAELLASGRLADFAEWEVDARTQRFGRIAQRWSTYEKSGVLDGKPFRGGGTKAFELVKAERGWKIAALAWQDEEG